MSTFIDITVSIMHTFTGSDYSSISRNDRKRVSGDVVRITPQFSTMMPLVNKNSNSLAESFDLTPP